MSSSVKWNPVRDCRYVEVNMAIPQREIPQHVWLWEVWCEEMSWLIYLVHYSLLFLPRRDTLLVVHGKKRAKEKRPREISGGRRPRRQSGIPCAFSAMPDKRNPIKRPLKTETVMAVSALPYVRKSSGQQKESVFYSRPRILTRVNSHIGK